MKKKSMYLRSHKQMKFLSKWCLVLLFMTVPLNMFAQNKQKAYLYVEKTNGDIIKFRISGGYPTLYPSSSKGGSTEEDAKNLDIYTSRDEIMTIPRQEVKRLYARFETTNLITDISANDNTPVKIYTPNGILVNQEGNLQQLPKGVYLIKKGKETTKYIIR